MLFYLRFTFNTSYLKQKLNYLLYLFKEKITDFRFLVCLALSNSHQGSHSLSSLLFFL